MFVNYLEIPLPARRQPQTASMAPVNATSRRGNALTVNRDANKTAASFCATWTRLAGAVRKYFMRGPLRPASVFKIAAGILQIESAPGTALLKSAYCKEFEKYAAIGPGLPDKARTYLAHCRGMAAIQPDLPDDCLERLKSIEAGVCKRFAITDVHKHEAEQFISDMFGGNLPTRDALKMLRNFMKYEERVRAKEVLRGQSLFRQLDLPPKKIEALHQQFGNALRPAVSDAFKKLHSQNVQGSLPEMVLMAYTDALSTVLETSQADPRGYADTMKAVLRGIAHTLRHNIGQDKDWSAPVEATVARASEGWAAATEVNAKAIKSAMQEIFPTAIEKYTGQIRDWTIERAWPENAIAELKENYFASFGERRRKLFRDARGPVAPALLWTQHKSALAHAVNRATNAAMGEDEIYSEDHVGFKSMLEKMCAYVDLELNLHPGLGEFGKTMPSPLPEAQYAAAYLPPVLAAMPAAPDTISDADKVVLNAALDLKHCEKMRQAVFDAARTRHRDALPQSLRKSLKKMNGIYDALSKKAFSAPFNAFRGERGKRSVATDFWIATMLAEETVAASRPKLDPAYLQWMKTVSDDAGTALGTCLCVKTATQADLLKIQAGRAAPQTQLPRK